MKTERELGLNARMVISSSVTALALLSNLPAQAQTTDTWSLGSSGDWSVATDWSTGVVPNNGTPSGATYNVDIVDGVSTVTLDMNATISGLTTASGNTLAIADGQTLAVVGPTIANGGSIQVNGGAGNNAILDIAGNVTLSGAGTLTLSSATGGGDAYIQQASGGLTLTNSSTIQGAGIIGNNGLTLVNSGTIDANTKTGVAGITLNGGGGITNTGTLEATAGGTLTVDNNVVNTGGKITASGTGSMVDLDGVTITGGTLTAKTGGALETQGTTTLSGVTLAAGTTYPVADGTTTVLVGPFTNNGAVTITGGNANDAILDIGSNLTLSGPVTLSTATGGGSAIIQQNSGGLTLTTTGTIQGAGTIGNNGLTLVNSGTINANTTSGVAGITLNGGGNITNTGTLEATNGATLTVANNVVNTGANITASGTGSIVDLDGVTITGGTLTASGGAALTTSGTTTLSGLTIGTGTTYPVADGTTTVLVGPITNNGTIQMTGGGGNNAILNIGSNLTLSGPVTLSTATGGGDAIIQQGSGGLTLTTTGTITGAGIIGNNGLTVVNSGTVNANTTAGVAGITLNGGGTITNTGLLEATNGATLTVANNVVNSGANITASGAGSVVDLDGVSITGGTLTASGGGALTTAGTTTLTGVTTASGTIYPVAGGTTTVLVGPFTNGGTIVMTGGNGNNATLDIGSNLTLGGTVTLSTATIGGGTYIQQASGGLTLTNAGTIQGAGTIGNNGLVVVNGTTGIIDANAIASAGQSNQLLLNGGGITNMGLLEATNGATLTVANNVVNTGANITASGTGSVVDLAGVTITGGTLTASGGGALETTGNNTLTGVTIATGTTYPVAGGTTTVLNGPITNNGIITVAGGGGSNAILDVGNSQTLGGTVTLSVASGGGSAYIQQGSGGLTLTNAGTIQGTGTIGNNGLAVVNSAGATIAANTAGGGTLLLNGGAGFTNSGTLQVASGDLLQVDTGTFTNFSGTTLKGGSYNVSGTLQIYNLGTAGGEIKSNDANLTLSAPGAAVEDADGNNALSKFATNAAKGVFTLAGGDSFKTAGIFNNVGTLVVGAGSTFTVGTTLKNYATGILTGGVFDLTGDLDFKGAAIVTNAASITLDGTSAEIVNSTGNKNGLAGFAANSATGSFNLAGGANFTTAGNFSTAGTLSIASGSTLTAGGTGVFTQTAGTTTDSGTLAASGGVALSGGSLFGTGTITGALQSSATVTPGASATATGILTDSGAYTQSSTGSLDIGIAGKTAGTKYDVFDSTTAVLGGTLNLTELKGFVPTVGETFKILNFNSETGTFATVNGLTINSTEAYTVTYQPTDVLLTVVSTPAPASPAARISDSRLIGSGDARLASALREFNAGYGVEGTRFTARNVVATPRAVERTRMMDLVKELHR
jgi:hypothetical protein